jgi:hypothetical protein
MIRTEAITASGPCHNRKTYVPRSPYRSVLTRFSVHLLLKPYTAAILRVCYSAWESLDHQGRSPGSLREGDLVRELAGAGLAQSTAEMCASLCSDVDWTAKSPLSAWLKAIRSFYLPRLPYA